MTNLSDDTRLAVELLKELITTPSFSREEDQAAGVFTRFLALQRVEHARIDNNVYAFNQYFNPTRPTILLNSHLDTVKPAPAYTLDPFEPLEKDGKLYGLGSNDAGGSLVALTAAFLHYYSQQDLPYNLILAATAEEEISGNGGIERLLGRPAFLERLEGRGIDCGIVGEPTQMQMAIAEKGLMVVDAVATGQSGHAAREEGDNAIMHALRDIQWLHQFQFEKASDLLGPVKTTVTVIDTENKAHNVVPSRCHFVIDIRVNEQYRFEEILETLRGRMHSELLPRSTRLRSTLIPEKHPLVQAGLALGRYTYGSPTTSDKALMPFPALKMGPGDSARSHTADEFIFLSEIEEGIRLYIRLLDKVMNLST